MVRAWTRGFVCDSEDCDDDCSDLVDRSPYSSDDDNSEVDRSRGYATSPSPKRARYAGLPFVRSGAPSPSDSAEAAVDADDSGVSHATPFCWDGQRPLDRALTAAAYHAPLHHSPLLSSRFAYPARTALESLQADLFGHCRFLPWNFRSLTNAVQRVQRSSQRSVNQRLPTAAAIASSPLLRLRIQLCDRPYVSACRFDRVGGLLAVASSYGELHVYDADVLHAQHIVTRGKGVDAQPVRRFTATSGRIDSVVWDPLNEDRLAACSTQHAHVELYSLGAQSVRRYSVPGASSVVDAAFLPFSREVLYVSTAHGDVRYTDLRTPHTHLLSSMSRPSSSNPAVVLRPSDCLPLLYVLRSAGQLELWDLRAARKELRKTAPLSALAGTVRLTGADVGDAEADWLLQGSVGEVTAVSWTQRRAQIVEERRGIRDVFVDSADARRTAVWMRGHADRRLAGMARRRAAVVAHATRGAQVRFSLVPLDTDGPVESAADESGRGCAVSPGPHEPQLSCGLADPQCSQTTQAVSVRPVSWHHRHTECVYQRRSDGTWGWVDVRLEFRCGCCTQRVGSYLVPAPVTAMDSHPFCGYVVCGMNNNCLCVVEPAGTTEESEEGEYGEDDVG